MFHVLLIPLTQFVPEYPGLQEHLLGETHFPLFLQPPAHRAKIFIIIAACCLHKTYLYILFTVFNLIKFLLIILK